jgi:type IX secretion system PorP/SprF family membrane protein
MVNPYLVNPALAGAENFIDIKFGYRNQWSGLDGAPTTFYASGHTPIGKAQVAQTHKGDYHNWHGIGGFVYRDEIGPLSTTSMNANYAYNMKLTEGAGFNTHHKDGIRLSIGTFLGYSINRVDAEKLFSFNSNAGDFNNETSRANAFGNDPLFAQRFNQLSLLNGEGDIIGDGSKGQFDMSLGGLVYLRDLFYVGLSTYQALGANVFEGTNTNNSRHYMVTASYKAELGNYIYLMPSILAKKVSGAPFSIDVNARVDYHDLFFGGISYRHGDAIALMAGTIIELQEKTKHFRKGKHRYGVEVFYSYDFTTSEIRTYSKGSHEITLGFRLPPMLQSRNAESTWR